MTHLIKKKMYFTIQCQLSNVIQENSYNVTIVPMQVLYEHSNIAVLFLTTIM